MDHNQENSCLHDQIKTKAAEEADGEGGGGRGGIRRPHAIHTVPLTAHNVNYYFDAFRGRVPRRPSYARAMI